MLVIYLGHIFCLFCVVVLYVYVNYATSTSYFAQTNMCNSKQSSNGVDVFYQCRALGWATFFVSRTDTQMLTLMLDRPGDGVVSVVHRPVPQAGLPAADHRPWWRRAAGRTRCRNADRRSVSDQRRRVCGPRSRLLDRLQPSPHHQYPFHCRPAQRRRRTS